jgi:hypothetical protein
MVFVGLDEDGVELSMRGLFPGAAALSSSAITRAFGDAPAQAADLNLGADHAAGRCLSPAGRNVTGDPQATAGPLWTPR